MKRFIISITLISVVLAGGVANAGKGGNGNGKKPIAAVETVVDTAPEETIIFDSTTTIPFDPGTDISGDLTMTDNDLRFGGFVDFDVSYSGTPSNRGTLYVSVVCWYSGPKVVYQWAQWDEPLHFPFQDQTGDNLDWTAGNSAQCQADYIYRIINDKDHSYKTLDSIVFAVVGSS